MQTKWAHHYRFKATLTHVCTIGFYRKLPSKTSRKFYCVSCCLHLHYSQMECKSINSHTHSLIIFDLALLLFSITSFQVKYLGLSSYCNTSRILSLPHCLASLSYLAMKMATLLGDYKSEENTTSLLLHKCGSFSVDSVHSLDQDQKKLGLSLGNRVNSHHVQHDTVHLPLRFCAQLVLK